MLEYIITSKAKRSLLKLLLTNPDREFYTREISRRTGEPLNAVRRELGYLEKAGLLRSRHAGNLKYYSVVKEFPFYPELKKIVAKCTVFPQLKSMEKINKTISYLFMVLVRLLLYGEIFHKRYQNISIP